MYVCSLSYTHNSSRKKNQMIKDTKKGQRDKGTTDSVFVVIGKPVKANNETKCQFPKVNDIFSSQRNLKNECRFGHLFSLLCVCVSVCGWVGDCVSKYINE